MVHGGARGGVVVIASGIASGLQSSDGGAIVAALITAIGAVAAVVLAPLVADRFSRGGRRRDYNAEVAREQAHLATGLIEQLELKDREIADLKRQIARLMR